MTVSIRAIKEAIAEALTAIDGLNTSPQLTNNVIPPHAMVRMTEVDYRQTFGNGLTSYPMAIVILAPSGDTEGGQDFLDECALPFGVRSVREILEDTVDVNGRQGTLGGLVDFIAVDSVGDLEIRLSASDQNIRYLAREWECRVDVSN